MDGPHRRKLLAGAAAALLVAVPIVSLGAHFVSILGRDLHPGRDHSIYELNTIGFLHGEQLDGPYSQFGWHHLGPAFFALLAPPYALSGFRSSSLVLTMLVWSATMIVVFVATARKYAGASGAVAGALAIAAFLEYENRLPLYNYWAPFFGYLAFPACTALIARVSGEDGDRALPWALSLSSVLVQTHIGVAPPLAGFWVLALSVRAATRRREGSEGPMFTRRSLVVSAAALAAFWVLPVVAELRGAGNWSRIVEFFGSHRGSARWSVAVDRAAAEMSAPFRRMLFDQDAYMYVRGAPPHMGAWRSLAVLFVVALAGTLALSWRLRKPFLTSMSACALYAAALSPFAIRRVVGPVEPHYVAWVAGATVVGLTAIAGTAGAIVAWRWPVENMLRRRARIVAPWLVFSVLSAWLATARAFVPEAHLRTPALTRLADRIDARMRAEGARALVLHGTPATMPWHYNLGLELYRRGHPVTFRVSRADFYVGPFWTRPNDASVTVHLVGRRATTKGTPLGCEDPPPGSLIVGSVCAWLEVTAR